MSDSSDSQDKLVDQSSDSDIGDENNQQHIVIPPSKIDFPETMLVEIVAKPSTLAEPSPIGMSALAIGCLMLSFAHFGITPASTALQIPWVIFLMGFMMFIAGIVDAFKQNLFGSTVFLMYSCLWVALGLAQYSFKFGSEDAINKGEYHISMCLIGYFIFNLAPLLVSLQLNKVLFLDMLMIQLLLFVLILQFFNVYGPKPAGIFLLFISFISFYWALAELIEQIAGGPVLPKGTQLYSWKKKEEVEEDQEEN
ncbi:inner membrane protein yaah [Anaeramoeba flamelloides]|uniref:Inner membrane protein yaah n=1 Tax=Anaeramoeba flamelloides TaxID=1746091 RepID=A0ABQ8Z464_9EUKA|nr:inner membrane protein yaah [Anaeramoeba flamelloides]